MEHIIISKNLSKYFKALSDELSCHFVEINAEKNPQEYINERSLALISLEAYQQLENSQGNIVIVEEIQALSSSKQKELEVISDDNLKAILDCSLPVWSHIPILKNLMKDPRQEYQALMGKTVAELQRLKRLHEKLVPLRNQKIKGMQVFSKYIAGESSGGEFFDFVGDDREYLFFMVSSSSYLATSHTISQFEFLSGRSSITRDVRLKFLESLIKEVREYDIPDLGFDLLLAHIDLKKMVISGHNIGNAAVVSDHDNCSLGQEYSGDLEKNSFEWTLKRGEKVVALSAGVGRNCNGIVDGKRLNDFAKDKMADGPAEFLNELFFQLKRGASSTFLKHDASAIYMEVDKNVFIEI